MTPTDEIRVQASKIRLLALDSDGVLTDGGVYINTDGSEFRRFDIKDGLGLKLLLAAGLQIVIISGGTSCCVKTRANSLGIMHVYLDVIDKLAVLREICEQFVFTLDQIAYIGDDKPDLPALRAVGLSCAPNDAHVDVISSAMYVASKRGGQGAVREICDVILACQQK